MEFDYKSQHYKCKAKCCYGVIDFSKEIWEWNQHKAITKPSAVVPFPDGSIVMHKTEKWSLRFLRDDYHCNIYEDRPEDCIRYGDESAPEMSCQFLKKDGSPIATTRKTSTKNSRQKNRYPTR